VRGLFTGGRVTVVGGQENSGLMAFVYLLLCHIRREHLGRLRDNLRASELNEIKVN